MGNGDENAPGEKASAEEQANEHVKEFFLHIAKNGKDAWNAWRHDPANKDVSVTFAHVDFSVAPNDKIDFSGFEFGDADKRRLHRIDGFNTTVGPNCENSYRLEHEGFE